MATRTGGRAAMPPEEKAARAERLRKLRSLYMFTQQEVADRGEIPRELVSKFESGLNAATTSETQRALGKAFGLSTDAIADYLDGKIDIVDIELRRQKYSVAENELVDVLRDSAATPTYNRDDRYTAMPAVRAMARAQGFDDAFIKTWEVHLDADDQPDADYLWTLCKADYARWQKKSRAAGNPIADLDDPPVRTARKNR